MTVLTVPVQSALGERLLGVRIRVQAVHQEMFTWWTGQFVRLRDYGSYDETGRYYFVVNSGWSEESIRNHPSGVYAPPYRMTAEIWGEMITTPSPAEAFAGTFLKTDGFDRYQRGLLPDRVQDMRETDGVWVVDYNLLLAVSYMQGSLVP